MYLSAYLKVLVSLQSTSSLSFAPNTSVASINPRGTCVGGNQQTDRHTHTRGEREKTRKREVLYSTKHSIGHMVPVMSMYICTAYATGIGCTHDILWTQCTCTCMHDASFPTRTTIWAAELQYPNQGILQDFAYEGANI